MAALPSARVSDFVDSIGVNTHMGYLDTPYGDVDQILQEIQYLGVEHVRDSVAWPAFRDALAQLGDAGIGMTLMVGGQNTDTLANQLTYVESLGSAVDMIEGPNEVNFWPVSYDGKEGTEGARATQQAIYEAVKADASLSHIPVASFTVAGSSEGDFAPYGDNSAYADYGNAHVYFPAGTAPRDHFEHYSEMAGSSLAPGKPMIVTETGFPSNAGGDGNQGVSELAQAKYTLDLLLDAYQQGVERTFLYELHASFDDADKNNQEAYYGLFRYDGTAKPVATALHNLTTILDDDASNNASFTTSGFDYSVSGLTDSGSHMLLQEANGNHDIVVWNEPAIWDDAKSADLSVSAQKVTVDLGDTFGTVHVYDPLKGSAAVATYRDVSSVTLGITDHPLIVETVDSTKAEPQTNDGDGQTIMTLKMSGDDWQGAAQFSVSVDGQQQGDVYTVGAARAEGDTQDFTFHGSWGDGEHSLEITYLNDSWGGTADTDRNLYLEGVSFGGTEHDTGITMLTNGTYRVDDLMAS